jgi:3D (Asp-Asp-Asp) domain-containing protein
LSIATDQGQHENRKNSDGSPRIRVIPYFTSFQVKELKGLSVPTTYGGGIHTGTAISHDAGGAIIGLHLDCFVGDKAGHDVWYKYMRKLAASAKGAPGFVVHVWFDGIERLPDNLSGFESKLTKDQKV